MQNGANPLRLVTSQIPLEIWDKRPQILQKSGIHVAAFGRGVKPIGFDNQVLEDEQFTSQFSEMYWQGADGSRVLGILFANWYSNGNEIPVDKDEALTFWKQNWQTCVTMLRPTNG